MTVRVVASDLGVLPELAYKPSFIFEAANSGVPAETIVRHLHDRHGAFRGARDLGSVDESLRSVVRRTGREKRRLRARSGTLLVEPRRRLSAELDRELITHNGS